MGARSGGKAGLAANGLSAGGGVGSGKGQWERSPFNGRAGWRIAARAGGARGVASRCAPPLWPVRSVSGAESGAQRARSREQPPPPPRPASVTITPREAAQTAVTTTVRTEQPPP